MAWFLKVTKVESWGAGRLDADGKTQITNETSSKLIKLENVLATLESKAEAEKAAEREWEKLKASENHKIGGHSVIGFIGSECVKFSNPRLLLILSDEELNV